MSNAAPEAPSTEPQTDWLHDLPSKQAASTEPPDAQSDWLRDLPAEEEASGETIPSWLRSAEEETPQQTQQLGPEEDLPSWLRSVQSANPAPSSPSRGDAVNEPSSDNDASSDEIPEWLRSATETSQAEDNDSLPAWLLDRGPDDTSTKPFSSPKSDRWSQKTTRPGEQPSSDTQAQLPPLAERLSQEVEGVPTWLRNISDDEIHKVMAEESEDITVEPFTFEGATESSGTRPAAGLPSWLSDVTGGSPEEATSWLDEIVAKPEESSSAQSDEGIPAWLHDLGSSSTDVNSVASLNQHPTLGVPTEPELRAGQASETEGVDRDDRQAEQPDEGQPPSSEEYPDVAIPDWLRLGSQEPAPPMGDRPDWLQSDLSSESTDLTASWTTEGMPSWSQTEQPSAAASPRKPDEDMPSWLREEQPTPLAPQESGEDLPDWLQSHATDIPEIGSGSTPPTSSEEDLPPWLRDEAGAPLPTAGINDANLPEWLRGASFDSPPLDSLETSTVAPTQGGESPLPTESHDLDWFNETAAADRSNRSTTGDENEFLGGMELPAWLRPPEPEAAPEISPTDARSLDWLTRLTPSEEEQATIATVAPKLTPPAPLMRTPTQVGAMEILTRLTADPFPNTTPLPVPTQVPLWQRMGIERVLYIALLVALVAALIAPMVTEPLQKPPQVASAAPLLQQISKLSAQDVVLVGYEWDARRISELQPLEQAILGQLIDQRVKMILVSTNSQGTLLSYNLRDRLEQAGYQGGGLEYILLGYKPGGETALRLLSQDFRGALSSDFQGNDAAAGGLANGIGTNKPLQSLKDLSMVIVLADDPVDVQSWMEQIHSSAPNLPIAFLLPTESSPIIQPYTQIQNVYYLAGGRGALAYQSLRNSNGASAEMARAFGYERFSLLVFVILFAFGALVISVTALFKRRGKPS